MLPIWKEAANDLQQYWNALSVKQEMIDRAKTYISEAMGDATHAVGMHVRRGDYKSFNFQNKVTDPKKTEAAKDALERVWEYADQNVEEQDEFKPSTHVFCSINNAMFGACNICVAATARMHGS